MVSFFFSYSSVSFCFFLVAATQVSTAWETREHGERVTVVSGVGAAVLGGLGSFFFFCPLSIQPVVVAEEGSTGWGDRCNGDELLGFFFISSFLFL
jgi:hypothetical protein